MAPVECVWVSNKELAAGRGFTKGDTDPCMVGASWRNPSFTAPSNLPFFLGCLPSIGGGMQGVSYSLCCWVPLVVFNQPHWIRSQPSEAYFEMMTWQSCGNQAEIKSAFSSSTDRAACWVPRGPMFWWSISHFHHTVAVFDCAGWRMISQPTTGSCQKSVGIFFPYPRIQNGRGGGNFR